MASPCSSSTTASDRAPRVLFVTLGCAKNEVDTDRMRALMLAAGFEETLEAGDADVVQPHDLVAEHLGGQRGLL